MTFSYSEFFLEAHEVKVLIYFIAKHMKNIYKKLIM
jgi:hypothetical protein